MGVMKTPIRIIIPLIVICVVGASAARATCQEGCDANVGNTFLGEDALINDLGEWNTAVGFYALKNIDSTVVGSTAVGFEALSSNVSGSVNTALGSSALTLNTTGADNTAAGAVALASNTTGDGNTAIGGSTMYGNRTGFDNTATGSFALYINTTGSYNTATGFNALEHNLTGSNNIAMGMEAGAAITGDANIDIGNGGVAGESGRIRIGTERIHTATYIAGIRQAPLANGTALAVGITADGQLGVRVSSARFKKEIKPMDKASEAILGLKPVSFRYKKDLDPKGAPQFGLVAEEVAKVNPDLVVADDQGKPFTVRYEEVNAMLLNEFLKEHKKVEELQATVRKLEAAVDKLNADAKARD
jgi:Chaperone of endosialidase